MEFTGAYTALVTPFRNGQVDEDAYRAHIEWQIEQGINGLVPCGTTGESATMSHAEHKRVIGICVDQVRGRVPVLAGAGSNNTIEAIELARHAKEAGADGILLITPYYNKPSQEGLINHFKAIAAEVDMPTIVYNVPSRTGVNLLPATVRRLQQEIPCVLGIKEATGSMAQASDIIELCGPEFQLLSGDDFTVLPFLSLGGRGVISVVSNIVPAKMAALCQAWARGDMASARALHYALMPLSRAMFLEVNPVPAKTALALMGRFQMEVRLPLTTMTPENHNKLAQALGKAGLI